MPSSINENALVCGAVVQGRSKQWRLEALLGEGSQGRVFRARDVSSPDAQPVAIKFAVASPDTGATIARSGLMHEGDVIVALPWGPGLLVVLDRIDSDGVHGLVMPLCEGTFDSLLDQAPTRALLEKWFGQLALALSTLHGASIVHGDLKESNVYFTHSRGSAGADVAIGDFGTACRFGYFGGGTPTAMAPEVARVALYYGATGGRWSMCPLASGDESTIGPTADTYSLALMLLRAVDPAAFAAEQSLGASVSATLESRASGSYPDVDRKRLGPALYKFFGRALALDPKARFSALEFAEQLTVLRAAEVRRSHVVWAARNVVLPLVAVSALVVALVARRAEARLREADGVLAQQTASGTRTRSELLSLLGSQIRVRSQVEARLAAEQAARERAERSLGSQAITVSDQQREIEQARVSNAQCTRSVDVARRDLRDATETIVTRDREASQLRSEADSMVARQRTTDETLAARTRDLTEAQAALSGANVAIASLRTERDAERVARASAEQAEQRVSDQLRTRGEELAAANRALEERGRELASARDKVNELRARLAPPNVNPSAAVVATVSGSGERQSGLVADNSTASEGSAR